MFFRMMFGLPGAAAITALLFLAMGWMIRQDATTAPPVEAPKVYILAKLKPSDPIRAAPPAREAPKPPPAIELDFPPPGDSGSAVPYEPAQGPARQRAIITFPSATKPTLTFPPAYPENCRARDAQGVVMVEFDVTPEGNVVNPRVVASENSCLDRAAINTISKWKFQPQTDDSGRPIAQRNLRQAFNYQLTE